ncbi:hypothetical protein Pcac1_g2313 [Phytophthora cactorum]|uniref:Uncharacterized protein n=2 Tax=Phytophthora cactorum TaxID=29920 RepID=A0A329RLA4_9STRA|nr:hypothetical protein Pcac1_g2313 [Phytophthora cactorum]KAG2804849.1 hypothetical protein PC112_g18535 [Phytophthora cactorum]KAG2806193.1 hypothetical protein PC111_g17477 [Phytophthora cactorum]RAW25151.1 hypothetical protein PC110_g18430 [Phytophthora cactorum]
MNKTVNPSEIPTCAKQLQAKYGDLAAFSVTSAATDLKVIMTKHTNGASTFVVSGSYGSVLMERFMNSPLPMVSGYVLDSIATALGAPADEFLYLSNWGRYFGEVGDNFLALRKKDHSVRIHFGSTSLRDTLQNVIEQFEKEPNSTCAKLISNVKTIRGGDPPAVALRVGHGALLMDMYQRRFISAFVYRLNRCEPDDVDVLTLFIKSLNALSDPIPEDAYASALLYYLIVYSEMWENPTPDQAQMTTRFMNSRISNGQTYLLNSQYCAFSKAKSSSCDEFGVGRYDANGIIYEHDQYWNKTASIPKNTSVLLFSGGLDPQTPSYEGLLKIVLKSIESTLKE